MAGPTRVTAPTGRALWLGAAAAAIAVLATHAVVLTFGLRYDDYMMLRPLGSADIHQVLTGNWGPVGDFQDAYYRPITALYHAGLFDAFGLRAWPMHLVSLIELWLVACLTGLFVWRDAGPLAAAVTVAAYVLHPVLPDSTSAWILNQMHLLALLVVAGTLLLWQRRRQDPHPRAWWPIFALTIIGVFIKEDTVMVLPAVLILQWCRARFVRDVPTVHRSLWVAAGATVLALALQRLLMFPHFDVFGSGEPRTWLTIATIALYGPLRSSTAMFQGGTIAIGATAFVLLLHAFGARHARRDPASPTGWLWIQGAVLLVCFSLPIMFVFDAKSTRLHLVVLAAALMWSASALALRAWLAPMRRAWRVVGIVTLVAGATHLAILQHTTLVTRFAPCGEEDLWFDHDTRAWPVVTADITRWLALKAADCSAGHYQPLDTRMDVLRWPQDDGAVLLVNRAARSIAFSIGRTSTDGATTTAHVIVDGVTHEVPLPPDARTIVRYFLTDSWPVRVRAAHRIDIAPDLTGSPIAVTSIELDWRTPQR